MCRPPKSQELYPPLSSIETADLIRITHAQVLRLRRAIPSFANNALAHFTFPQHRQFRHSVWVRNGAQYIACVTLCCDYTHDVIAIGVQLEAKVIG